MKDLFRYSSAILCILAIVTKSWTAPSTKEPSTVWQPVSLTFSGPDASETDVDPNPFVDYRLQVKFTGPANQEYDVPGFYDGDGNGGPSGNVWRVRFSPDTPGTWKYQASFRTGDKVALALDPEAGTPTAFDGASGSIQVNPRNPEAPGFLKWGRLKYVGKHYLKFQDGKVIEATASKNQDFLKEMLATDENASYVGEFGIGMNPKINKFTKNLLFDEKIGGTIHLALGAAYKENGGGNDSAIHWDIVKDIRNAKIILDEKTIQSNGVWKI